MDPKRPETPRAAFLALLIGVVLTQSGLAGPIYKWVDEKGVTHYSESPPPKQKAAEIQVKPSEPPTAGEAAKQFGRSWQEQEREFQQRRVERQEAERREREQDTAAKRAALARKQRCILARQNLHVLEMQRPVYTIDEKGERAFVEDAARGAEMARMKKEIARFCEP